MIRGIDHLVVAVRSVDDAAALVERDLGLAVTGGGRHTGMGTVNRLAFLGDAYLELIGVEDAAVVRSSTAFAVGAAALAQLEARGEGLATYALATDDLAGDRSALAAEGSPIGEAVPGLRVRPDGGEVRWWCAFPSPLGPDRPPFLIEHVDDDAEWGPQARATRASFRHPAGGTVRLASLTLPVADPAAAAHEHGEVLGLAFAGGWRATVGEHQVLLREGGGVPTVELRADPGTPSLDLVRFGVRWRRAPRSAGAVPRAPPRYAPRMPDARDITLRTTSGRRLAAHLARPDGRPGMDPDIVPRPGPAVIVVHEAMGLNDDIRRITRRFAEHGYVALAPDLVGAGFKPLCIARFFAGIGRVGTGRPYVEMAAFQDWLAGQPDVDADRIGMAGFCAGGGFTMLYAARGGRPLRAIAPFYAALPADASLIPDLCPTVASYGGRDRVFGHLGPRLEAALGAAGVPHDVKTYPEAGHSFMNRHEGPIARVGQHLPMHDAFDESASTDAWARVLAFFDEHLGSARA